MTGPHEAGLIAAAQAGDRDAADRLLRLHVDRIYALCRRMTGGGPDTDDATQEALIAILRGLPRFDGRAAFSTWAYRVATNACLDELRRKQRRPIPSEDVVLDHAGGALRPSGAETQGMVSARIDIDAALARLAPDFRAPVVLRDLLGFDYGEIAETLDVPIGTVKSRIARGRAALARLLGGNQPEPTDRPSSRP